MNNPWELLSTAGPEFFLDSDLPYLQRFNSTHKKSPDFQIQLTSIPEPFVGNPQNAKLVFLLLNPGHSENDLIWQRKPDFRNCFINNLRHEENEFPFYPLDPRFKESGVGSWWRKKLKPLLEIHGEKLVSDKIMAIQWFPYHSVKYSRRGMRDLLPSQQYSHWLAQKMIDEGKEIIVMRSLKMWEEVVKFKKEPIVLKNPRNPTFSVANLGQGNFEKIARIIAD